MQPFEIQELIGQKPDGMGGLIDDWGLFKVVEGYLDLITGTDTNALQNASVEESTHILILPIFVDDITANMRLIDSKNRVYEVTYSDNPVGIDHHNEIYLKYGGDGLDE